MWVGVTPERYRLLLEDAVHQEYVVLGSKNSADAEFIAMKIGDESIQPKSLSISGLDVFRVVFPVIR
jgi:hypothetical protein